MHQGESTIALIMHSKWLRRVFLFLVCFHHFGFGGHLYPFWLLPFFSLLELGGGQMLRFLRIEEFGFILNGIELKYFDGFERKFLREIPS